MKKLSLQLSIVAFLFSACLFTSCKSKTKENTDSAVTIADSSVSTSNTASSPAVNIASDDELKKGVSDATKDYPDIKADVADSVITLSGTIKRADWQKLNPTLNSLHPKRVNSTQLTIK